MEPIQKDSNKIKGIEVLFFEEAELQKTKADSISFAAIGPLSVLYFKDYNRFVLQLNDWRYPLLRKLIVIASGPMEDINSHSYIFPALNGFFYNLRINKAGNTQALANLETILSHNSSFFFKGEETPVRKLEASPDDRLVRRPRKDTGPKEVITQTLKSATKKVMEYTETLKSGTKNLNSRKKRLDLKAIKNRDFKKDAHSTFKKDFFPSHQKAASEFMNKRKGNPNLTQAKEFEELRKTSESKAPAMFIYKDEIEEAILDNKDVAAAGSYGSELEKTGIINNLKKNFNTIKETVTQRIAGPVNPSNPLNQSFSDSQRGEGLIDKAKATFSEIVDKVTHMAQSRGRLPSNSNINNPEKNMDYRAELEDIRHSQG